MDQSCFVSQPQQSSCHDQSLRNTCIGCSHHFLRWEPAKNPASFLRHTATTVIFFPRRMVVVRVQFCRHHRCVHPLPAKGACDNTPSSQPWLGRCCPLLPRHSTSSWTFYDLFKLQNLINTSPNLKTYKCNAMQCNLNKL